MKRRVLATALILTLALSAAAGARALDTDGAGNGIADDEALSGVTIARDLYWAGQSMNVADSEIAGSLVCAGYDLTVANTSVGGSVRAAGNTLSFRNTKVEDNVTAAGNLLDTDADFEAAGVYMAGAGVVFDGACETLGVMANTVSLYGDVAGDAFIMADSVVIGPDAVVKGVLTVKAKEAPVIPATAQIGDLQFSKTDVADISDETAQAARSAAFVHKLTSRVYWVAAVALLAALFMLLIPDLLNGAAGMLRIRTLAMCLTGVVALLALPMLMLLLCLTFIGLPVAGLLALLSLTAVLFSVPFAGASAGRLVFPKMNLWLSSILGAAILSAARIIPYVGGLIVFASIIYTLGYFAQACYLRIANRRRRPAPSGGAPIVTAPVVPGSMELPARTDSPKDAQNA